MNKYLNQAKAAVITAGVVLLTIYVVRKLPVVGPQATNLVNMALTG